MTAYMLKPYQRNTRALVNYSLVLFLLFGSALKQFSDSHDPSHYLQKDGHCTVCISSLSLDNVVATAAPSVTIVINNQSAEIASDIEYRPVPISSSRNRGPPKIS